MPLFKSGSAIAYLASLLETAVVCAVGATIRQASDDDSILIAKGLYKRDGTDVSRLGG